MLLLLYKFGDVNDVIVREGTNALQFIAVAITTIEDVRKFTIVPSSVSLAIRILSVYTEAWRFLRFVLCLFE